MRKTWVSLLLASAIVGCGSSGTTPDRATSKPQNPGLTPPTNANSNTDPVVATIGTSTIRQSELTRAALDAYGLKVLMSLSQLQLAKDACKHEGIVLSDSDFAHERKRTLDLLFGETNSEDETNRLLEQFYNSPKSTTTPAELDILIKTNAYMRKLVEPRGDNVISDDDLKLEFDRQYGSKVLVRHIMVSNAQEATEVKRRLAAGEDFATLASQLSRHPKTRLVGGELPPFTAQDPQFPANFRSVAFSLKVGEVSDPVVTEGSYHIIRLEERISPKAVKFEDVRDGLKQSIRENFITQAINEVRNKFASQAKAQLKIEDAEIRSQFEKKLNRADTTIRDREKISREMEKQRDAILAPTTAATTKPVAAVAPAGANTQPKPATVPATQP